MGASDLANRFLENDIRVAVEREQFTLAYQPVFAADDLAVLGFEALLRWDHPERGSVPPSVFIPVAEGSSQITPLGEWALGTACAEAARWPDPLRVAVNVSPVQFAAVDLPALVRDVVRETGIDPRRLDLEVTETAVIKDIGAARRIFGALRGLGVHVVLDDFGAGYSSLQILKSLPFDKVKIDRSLLADVGRDGHANAIIAAILQLTRTLDLRVTVEGVETEEQLARLRREGCQELQGFLLGRPEPIAAYAEVVNGFGRPRRQAG
jgi:EAL domain-containing protein (putative c-di-GMP-specific phosphodiesterase class I)